MIKGRGVGWRNRGEDLKCKRRLLEWRVLIKGDKQKNLRVFKYNHVLAMFQGWPVLYPKEEQNVKKNRVLFV